MSSQKFGGQGKIRLTLNCHSKLTTEGYPIKFKGAPAIFRQPFSKKVQTACGGGVAGAPAINPGLPKGSASPSLQPNVCVLTASKLHVIAGPLGH